MATERERLELFCLHSAGWCIEQIISLTGWGKEAEDMSLKRGEIDTDFRAIEPNQMDGVKTLENPSQSNAIASFLLECDRPNHGNIPGANRKSDRANALSDSAIALSSC